MEIVLLNISTQAIVMNTPDAEGYFKVSGLPPGGYRAYAWDDITRAEFRNQDELARQKNSSVEVFVDNDSRIRDVELPLIITGT